VLQRLPSVFICSAGREQPASLEDNEEAIEDNLSITSDVDFELKDGWQWSKTGQALKFPYQLRSCWQESPLN
jgi:hypothetical protein